MRVAQVFLNLSYPLLLLDANVCLQKLLFYRNSLPLAFIASEDHANDLGRFFSVNREGTAVFDAIVKVADQGQVANAVAAFAEHLRAFLEIHLLFVDENGVIQNADGFALGVQNLVCVADVSP